MGVGGGGYLVLKKRVCPAVWPPRRFLGGTVASRYGCKTWGCPITISPHRGWGVGGFKVLNLNISDDSCTLCPIYYVDNLLK